MKVFVSVDNSNLTEKIQSFQKGDKGFNINFTVTDEKGIPIVLTSKTVTFVAKNINTGQTLVSKICTIVDASKGTCLVPITDGDFNSIGIFEAYLTVSEGETIERKLNLSLFSIFE